MTVRENLEDWAGSEGIALASETWEQLEALVMLWKRYGAAFNLVGDRSTAALVEHVREGLMAVRVVERLGETGRWLDVGSGAGIPGLIVGVLRGNVVLLEPREKRAAFLELALSQLGVRDGAVFRARLVGGTLVDIASPVPDELLGDGFAVASAKAVMPVEKWIQEGRCLLPCGIVVCHVSDGPAGAVIPLSSVRVSFGPRVVAAFRCSDA